MIDYDCCPRCNYKLNRVFKGQYKFEFVCFRCQMVFTEEQIARRIRSIRPYELSKKLKKKETLVDFAEDV